VSRTRELVLLHVEVVAEARENAECVGVVPSEAPAQAQQRDGVDVVQDRGDRVEHFWP
jgi:hypothetical protein